MDFKHYINKTLGRCQITELIGVGGMGWVYLARHTELGVQRAVKVLKPVESTLEEARKKLLVERFVREARIAASLDHKNIIRIHDVGAFEGTHYIEMEYLKGVSLRQFITDYENSVPAPIAAAIIYLAADAIRYAHAASIRFDGQEINGVVHRDIKPENIFITSAGGLKVLDFGIAKLSNISLTTSAEARNVTGTLAYMSPEQIDGARVGPASDIFSMGTVFYELLTGKNPFLAEQMVTTVKNISTCAYRPLAEARPGLDPAFSKIIQRCLKYRPNDRFQSAGEIRDLALEILASHRLFQAEEGLREFVTTGKVVARGPAPAKRRSGGVFALVLALLLFCGAGVWYFQNNRQAQVLPEPAVPPVLEPETTAVVQDTAVPLQDTIKKEIVKKAVVVRPKPISKPPAIREPLPSVPNYDDSIRIAVNAGDQERALSLMLPRLARPLAARYAAAFPETDQAYYLFQGLGAFFTDNHTMAVSFFETALRKPTRFNGVRHRLIESALYYKALSYTVLFRNGDPAKRPEALKSWQGLKKMTRDSVLIRKADQNIRELEQ